MKVVSLAVMACLGLAFPSVARAQGVASFAGYVSQLTQGQTVVVRNLQGLGLKGRLTMISPSEIRLVVDGFPTRLTPDQVQAVGVFQRRVGFVRPLVGGTLGLIAGFIVGGAFRDCGECKAEGLPVFRALTTAIGAGAGVLIDIGRGHTHWLHATSKTVTIAPVLLPTRQSVTVRVRF
jgi:hypothetical protein